MPTKKIIDYIEEWADKEPNHVALISGTQEITYKKLFEEAYKYAAAFLKMGVLPGDRIAYMFDCCLEFFYMYLGASAVGIAVSGINSRSPVIEVNKLVNILDAKLLLCDYKKEEIRRFIDKKTHVVSFIDINNCQTDASHKSKVDVYREKVDGNTPVFIVFTSGTTGDPKGAVLTQNSIITSVKAQIREFGAPEGLNNSDIIQHHVPICHVSGAVQWGVAPLIAGCTMIVHNRFNAENVISNTEKYQATILTGVPSMWELMFRLPDFKKYDLTSVRWCATGAAPTNRRLAEKIFEICGNVSNPLGMTETSGFCSMFQGDTSIEKVISTVGKIIPELECRILDDKGNSLGVNEVGVLSYKGMSIIPRYLQKELPVTSDGFFVTSDLAFRDSEGYIHMCGRQDDMFMVGGHNVYPEEIEKLMLNYPNIGKAVVYPAPHSSMGNICKALIVPDAMDEQIDTNALIKYLENNTIYYKIPREIQIVSQLPSNTLGKIDRKSCAKIGNM